MKEKIVRNEEVALKILNGGYIAAIAREYRISSTRARQLLNKFCRKNNKKLYLAGMPYPGPGFSFREPPLKYLVENRDAFSNMEGRKHHVFTNIDG